MYAWFCLFSPAVAGHNAPCSRGHGRSYHDTHDEISTFWQKSFFCSAVGTRGGRGVCFSRGGRGGRGVCFSRGVRGVCFSRGVRGVCFSRGVRGVRRVSVPAGPDRRAGLKPHAPRSFGKDNGGLESVSPLADASQGGGELQFAVWKHNGGTASPHNPEALAEGFNSSELPILARRGNSDECNGSANAPPAIDPRRMERSDGVRLSVARRLVASPHPVSLF